MSLGPRAPVASALDIVLDFEKREIENLKLNFYMSLD